LFPRRGNGLDTYRRLDYPRVLFHDVFHTLDYDTATISSQDENWQGMLRFQQTGTPTYYWYSANHRGPRIDTGTEKIVPDDVTTDVALDWLSRRGDKPWALYMNFQGTHFPYSIGKRARRPYQPEMPTWPTFTYLRYPESEKQTVINRYDNALAQVDDQIARIYRYLKEVGELDNTLWIVTSDHGELFFDKGLVTHGRTLYEAEARVPLLLHWPDGIEPEERTDPVSHLDIMPTVLQLLGLPAHPAFQGRRFASASRSPGEEEPPAVLMNIQGLRFADAIVCWPYKLILDRTGETQLLFDLARDPAEANNIIEQHPEITTRLADSLKRQLLAQLDYHSENAADLRRRRYQPRLRRCPRLPKK
jgi:arylsulfatase A-like enzyme